MLLDTAGLLCLHHQAEQFHIEGRACQEERCGWWKMGSSDTCDKVTMMMSDNSVEETIFKGLMALLENHHADGSVVIVYEPQSRKFVQFGPGWTLVMDVPWQHSRNLAIESEAEARAT